MIGFMEAEVLKKMFGLTDQDIAVIDARLPDLVYVIDLLKNNQTVITRLVNQLGPIVNKIIRREQTLKS